MAWALAVMGALLAAGFTVTVVVAVRNQRRFDRQTDTGDLRQRVEAGARAYLVKRTNGALVIGLIQNGQTRVQGFGRRNETNAAPPDGATMFEIGSVTKVFTAALLARLAEDGRVSLEDRLEQMFTNAPAPSARAAGITLRQLATHSSGLPRLPENFDRPGLDEANPYVNYRAAELRAALARASPATPGRKYDYSNFGTAVLGHALETITGRSYGDLLEELLLRPLGLSNTVLQLDAAQAARLAPGHGGRGEVVPNWDFDVMAPAGALRSCADDLLRWLSAHLEPDATPTGRALARTQERHFKSWLHESGLGWVIEEPVIGWRLLWHNGGTGGYASFTGIDRGRKTGVVLLSNHSDAFAGNNDLDLLGMELLRLAAKVSWE